MCERMIAWKRQKREHCTARFRSNARKKRGSWCHGSSLGHPSRFNDRCWLGVAFETRPSTKRPVNRGDESQGAASIANRYDHLARKKIISSDPSVFLGFFLTTCALRSFFSPFETRRTVITATDDNARPRVKQRRKKKNNTNNNKRKKI